ncbi:hypothetical protein PsorP6_011529 [Peronosclerospora sorghi]|uniref:Uncharacterized protein n=1 Tax=Peronosclerospora sorghi TaxID=230839 RepID=A0ACC0WL50_9STRA|nr:hypothetical protein PsorP6_011529 [Peronosclerospora sorghi]
MRRSSRLSRDDDIVDIAVKRRKSSDGGRDSAVPTSALRSAWDEFLATNLFLKVPPDFYNVFDLASTLRPESPCEAFVETLGLRLCGPFDLFVAAKQKSVAIDKPLYLHGRYYFDPPEVATVLSDSDSDHGQHWGYFRDAPDQVPEYVVCAPSSDECKFNIVASSLVHVLKNRLKKRQSTLGKTKVATLLKKMEAYIEEETAPSVKKLQAKRKKEMVAASLHQLGIVVPVDTRTETGYRDLPITGKDLAQLLHQLKRDVKTQSVARNRLSELVTRATIASDECDFGTSLLLGLDVFTAGSCLEKEALQLLRVAYMLLRRADFYKIVSGHCTYRKGGESGACINSIVSSTSNALRADIQSKHVTTAVVLPPMFPNNERSKQSH